MIRPAELIERKRNGEELGPGELAELLLDYTAGRVPDEQMAAFCMAVYFRGLTSRERFELTDAMIRSGETVDLSSLGRTVVDKHSTGGVGDKTSIALGPIVAACGVPFAKMSGRGLGHTGGTLDKLESVPGYRIELDADAFVRQVRDVGMAIVGQTAGLVPADRRLYALRDVTATVDEISLIAASIVSKKIAAGADAVLLDVKVGEGAFMKTREDARRLASAMLDLGARFGRRFVCELTGMEQPLGRAVGNALEMREAIDMLQGDGPPDLAELVLRSAATLLSLSDLGVDEAEGRVLAERSVADGSAYEVYERWLRAQGGDPDPKRLPLAPLVAAVPSPAGGSVAAITATAVGRVAMHLGAGRARKEDVIDHATGVVCLAKVGDVVEPGQPLAEVHARTADAADAARREVAAAYRIAAEPVTPPPLVLEVMG